MTIMHSMLAMLTALLFSYIWGVFISLVLNTSCPSF
jgi:hypothetical protein